VKTGLGAAVVDVLDGLIVVDGLLLVHGVSHVHRPG
jgi:hypothetical protein